MIEIRHLTKQYGEYTAVDDLSFAVKDGAVYGLLGPNGAGKTTTMNLMTGYLAPTEGDVIIDGHDLLKEPLAAKRAIGYLPEVPPLYPDLTVGEYLRFAAELKGMRGKTAAGAAREAMERLELLSAENRLIRNLSKGYRQRTGFAQALLGDPRTLILDEPASGLDPKQIMETRDLIRELGRTHTVILSSHILSEVEELCTEVLILSEGRLRAEGTPGELRRMGGARELLILASGNREAAETALRTLAGTANPADAVAAGDPETDRIRIEETEDGLIRIRMAMPPGEDIRRAVSSALYEGGCPVLEMKTDGCSLEEIFLALTEPEPVSCGKTSLPA